MDFGGGWGDDDENDFLPEEVVSGPDRHGIITITSYRKVDGRKEKIVKKIKKQFKTKRVSRAKQERILHRRALTKFGISLGAGPGPDAETTIKSRDEVRIENPGDEAKAAKREEEDLLRRLREGRAKRQFNRKMEEKKEGIASQFGSKDEDGIPKTGGLRTGTALSEMAAKQAAGGGGGSGGKYVPIQLRGGAAAAASSRYDDGDQNTLRVTNISEDTTEDDLRELFSPFGRVQRVYLAKDRETHQSRGFAYISYHYREHAEKAMNKLNGFGYDHLILRVEWAKPSSREDAGSQNVMKHASGYGGALPQGLG